MIELFLSFQVIIMLIGQKVKPVNWKIVQVFVGVNRSTILTSFKGPFDRVVETLNRLLSMILRIVLCRTLPCSLLVNPS